MPFKPVASVPPAPAGPLELFDELPRRRGAIPELWRQQGEILTAYAMDFESRPDVAVELPTGTGKTMVGLLIAEWRRLKHRRPVLYACPTQQLVHQVAAVAQREGIAHVRLIGSHSSWASADKSNYDEAHAVGLTTYSSIFNAAPKVGSPGTIVFDDAHAGERYVAESWAVKVDRVQHGDAYQACLASVRRALSDMFTSRMEHNAPDLRARTDVQLVVPLRHHNMIESIDEALANLPKHSSAWWAWDTVRPGLASCLIYVSWHEILVRPFIPPTSENEPFSAAEQRVYLSATPGHAGELERSFGRSNVERLLLPDGRSPRSGRRFFIFADLADSEDEDLPSRLTEKAGKALVLGTSHEVARSAASQLNPGGWPVLTKEDVELDLNAFAAEHQTLLALAGRYDGIDLPNDACRLVALRGLPEWAHLQERYLSSNLRARAALEERTRTRVVQGAGRATRNPVDHALVLVQGDDLTRYLSSPVVRLALDADLQAEVAFGLENSRGATSGELLENVDLFLEQSDEWQSHAEPLINEARRDTERQDPPGSALLALSAHHEVEAFTAAFRSDFVGARDSALQAAAALSGDDVVRPYRAFWLYLSAAWSFAATASDPNAAKTGMGLLKEALKAAQGTSWLREVETGTQTTLPEDADDTPAVREIAGRLASGIRPADIKGTVSRIEQGISEVEHTKSEPALTELGHLLGAESFKPPGQGRADSVWCWAERVWIAIEAKSEQSPAGAIPLRDARQANTQLKQLAADRGVAIPSLAAVVLVSPRTAVADEAVTAARPEVHLAHPNLVRQISEATAECWKQLFQTHAGHTGDDLTALVRRTMAEHRVLPTQILERLTASPLKA